MDSAARSGGSLRFPELITKIGYEIKSFLLFLRDFPVTGVAPPHPLFLCHFSGGGKRACVAADSPPGIAYPLSEAGRPCGGYPRFCDLFFDGGQGRICFFI